ncbi:MAG: ABC transporter permease [Deltaproteobacteria bacterium]|nr:ABC transporter permease [Deltaproteobacteria bacterium]
MNKIVAVALNTFREAVRNKILYTAFFFALIVVIISALFGSVSIGDDVKVIKDFGLFALSFFGTVITIIAGVNLLNKELKQKTVYNILSKSVYRYQFILGKYLGLLLTVAMLVGLMGIGLMIFCLMMEGRIDYLLLQGIYFTILEMAIVAAIAIFFSSIVITTTLTGLFTLAFYLAGRSINYLKEFMPEGEYYNPLLQKIVNIFDFILPDLSRLNHVNDIVYNVAVPTNILLSATVYTCSYAAISVTLAILIFEKRELV